MSVDLRTPPPEPPPGAAGNTSASATSPTVSDERGHRRVLEGFLHAVDSDAAPALDGRQGRRSVALVQAVYESARTGAPAVPR